MATRKLFAGALGSLFLSLAVYAVLAGLLSWWYFAGFLSNPQVEFDPSRLYWMEGFWLSLSRFVPAICLWWLANFLGEARQQAPVHRRFAIADLWLLLAAILWGLLVYAGAAHLLRTEMFDCSVPEFQLIGDCIGPRRVDVWAGTGLAAAVFLFGLTQRLRGIPPSLSPAGMDAIRNDAVAAWINSLPSGKTLRKFLARLPEPVRDDVERSARDVHQAADAWLNETARAGDVDLTTLYPAFEAQLKVQFPWLTETGFRALRSHIVRYAWYEI